MLQKHLLFYFLIITMSSCKQATVVDAIGYIKYLDNKENGLLKEHTNEAKGLKIEVLYKTPEYMAIKEVGPDAFTLDTVLSIAKEFEGAYHFNFKISSLVSGYDVVKEKLSPKEYLNRITYLTGTIKNDFKLVVGIDTLPCAVCHFERSYNIGPDHLFLLAFPYTRSENEDLTLLYEDKVFGEGNVMFTIKKANIKNTPKLL